MKTVVMMVLYPIWFFLAKTWLGNMLMIPITIVLPMLPFNHWLSQSGPQAESIGIVFAILDLFILTPITFFLLWLVSGLMEEWYEHRGWKTEMETKWHE